MSDSTLMGKVEPSTEQEPNQVVEPSTTEAPEWLAGIEGINELPDDIMSDPSLKAIQNVPGLLKSYVNAQKLVGADKVIIPKKDAPEEDWRAFYQKAGLPDNYEDYSVTLPEVEDEGVKGYFEEYLKQAHEAGILPKQAEKLVEFQAQYAADQAKEAEAKWERALEEQEEQFKAEEGEKYDQTVFGAKLVVSQFDDDGAFTKMVEDDPMFGSNPTLIRFLSKISSHLTEDTFRNQAVSNIGTSADEAQQKLNSIQADYNGPYYNASHPDHKRTVQEVGRLTQRIMQG
jgi:hypothetical protein